MRSRTVSVLIVIALFAGCASGGASGRPAAINKPELDAGLANDVYFGSGDTAPAQVQVRMTNTANVPINIRRIEVDSPSMSQWGILRHIRELNKAIAPGATEEVILFATARTTVFNRTEPLSFRVIFTFEGGEPKSTWREYVNVIGTMSPH